jgi:hypothetical protein
MFAGTAAPLPPSSSSPQFQFGVRRLARSRSGGSNVAVGAVYVRLGWAGSALTKGRLRKDRSLRESRPSSIRSGCRLIELSRTANFATICRLIARFTSNHSCKLGGDSVEN